MNLEDIRDIKPPVGFPENYFLLIVIAAIILFAALFFLLKVLRKKKAKKQSEPSAPPKSAQQIAYEALEALRAKNLPRQGLIKQYYFELSDITRHYIENRFDIRAPEMTTEEFLFTLRDADALSGAHKNLLGEFLNLCDIVKFAKYGPRQQEIDDSFTLAKKLIDETQMKPRLTER